MLTTQRTTAFMIINYFRFIGACVLLLFVMHASYANSSSSQTEKIDIYFYQWAYVTDKPATPAEIRAEAAAKYEFVGHSYIEHFLRWLDVDGLQKYESEQTSSKRRISLVIDLTDNDGNVSSLYSDGCYLYSSDWAMRRKVDAEFRQHFDYGNVDMNIKSVVGNRVYKLCDY